MGRNYSKPINKENTLLNVFICNFDQEIQMNFLDKNIDIEPKEYYHKFYGWKFYDYGRNTNENKISQILYKLKNLCSERKFQNVLLIYDNQPNDNNNSSLKIMKNIVKNLNEILFPPLMIFVSDSIEKNALYYRNILKEYISNEHIEEGEEYDQLNISFFLYNANNFTNKLINELWKCTIYFNQIPSMYLPMTEENDTFEIKIQKFPNTLNLLLVGENGTGKSSLINILNNGKTAFESDIGIFKTNKINEYLITYEESEINKILDPEGYKANQYQHNRKFNYKISDTLGFSLDNKELPALIKYIKEYNDELIRVKDRIHCILYFLKEHNSERIYNNVIDDFFKYIYQNKIKVIFVINFNDGRRHICKNKLKKNFKLAFTEEMNNFFFEENDANIIELNLKSSNGVKQFGIGKLMEKLEKFFERYKIENIRNFQGNSLNEVLNYISNYPLYNDLRNIDDLCIKLIAKAKKLISYSIPLIIGISFIPIPGVDDVIAVSAESGLITAIAKIFGENISLENIKTIFKNLNFSSGNRIALLMGKATLRIAGVLVDIFKLLPGIGTIIGGALSCGINVTSLKITGNQAIEYLTGKFLSDLNPEKVKTMCEEYNDDIDGITYLKNLFNFYERKEAQP